MEEQRQAKLFPNHGKKIVRERVENTLRNYSSLTTKFTNSLNAPKNAYPLNVPNTTDKKDLVETATTDHDPPIKMEPVKHP